MTDTHVRADVVPDAAADPGVSPPRPLGEERRSETTGRGCRSAGALRPAPLAQRPDSRAPRSTPQGRRDADADADAVDGADAQVGSAAGAHVATGGEKPADSPGEGVARAVTLVGVSVRIDDVTVLHPLDLAIPRGGLTVIAGPNGAGKTTLLETIAGVRAPSTGVVRRRGAIAFVPQRAAVPGTLPLTVREVVEMGAWGSVGGWRPLGRAERSAVATATEALGLDHLTRRPFAELSGGQRQRALLAQALARRADLLLLDEPTTGLDDDSARRIQDAMDAETARGAAVLCVSHDRRLCERASRVIRLADGRLV